MAQQDLIEGATQQQPRQSAEPFLKWAGGKRWLVPVVGPQIRAYLDRTGGCFYEPFVGAGAMALWLARPQMVLNDLSHPLMTVWWAVKQYPARLAIELEKLVDAGVDAEAYACVREAHNRRVSDVDVSPTVVAARVVYLNRLSFNGLWRENAQGEYNVGPGKPGSGCSVLSFPTAQDLLAASRAIAGATICCEDFSVIIHAQPGEGDLILADPPYAGLGSFTGYTSGGFNDDDQRRLAEDLHAAADRGVAVIHTNADCKLTREIYSWATWAPTAESRVINCDAGGRRRTSCALIVSDRALLQG